MARPDARVQIRFCDDGVGMSETQLRRCFEPFFTTRLGKGGSGLGLSIVYNLATGVLGGTIVAGPRLGGGVEFLLDLPLEAPKSEPSDGAGTRTEE